MEIQTVSADRGLWRRTQTIPSASPPAGRFVQEYLSVFRPRFLNASPSPYVFLTTSGIPFNHRSLHQDFTLLILKRTGKRCYPHLLRTLWVSEFFAAGGKPATAAYMLNDTPQTALQRYYEFMDANHLQEASTFSQKLGK
jgi:site-specific recombinase XerD